MAETEKPAMRLTTAMALAVLICGCLSIPPAETTTTTLKKTTTPVRLTTTSSSTSTTSTTLVVNKTALCVGARNMEETYVRCRRYLTGNVSGPPSERRTCAEIRKNPRKTSRRIFEGLQNCIGTPGDGIFQRGREEGTSFCKDLEGQSQRDACYLSVRQCDRIFDKTMRQSCLGQSG